jgi:hypothetical protein
MYRRSFDNTTEARIPLTALATYPARDWRELVAMLRRCRRAAATWLGLIALLGNLALPTALSMTSRLAESPRDIPLVGLCTGSPSGAPGKVKPELPVQHCPLCATTAIPLPQPPVFAMPGETSGTDLPRFRTAEAVSPIRHGRIQPRAPPSAV